jgi:hypothetical protein
MPGIYLNMARNVMKTYPIPVSWPYEPGEDEGVEDE